MPGKSISSTLKRELIVAGVLIAIGLLVLPVAVYLVGQEVVGDYESDAGLIGLLGQIWSDFVSLEPGAWLLVLSPYAIVQLLRFALLVMKRRRRDVTEVTDSR